MSYFRGIWSHLPRRAKVIKAFASLSEKLCVYDIGSAGGCPPPFLFLLEHLNLVNFDPDTRLPSEPGRTIYPFAIGPESEQTFYLNQRPTTSSLRKPNLQYTDRYDFSSLAAGSADIFKTVKEIPVETISLDSFVEKEGAPLPDFAKIDVQGMTYEVLEGASRLLESELLGLEVEVEFAEHYKGQKTYGLIHELLYERGFEIFKQKNLCSWAFRSNTPTKTKPGQHQFCDFVYFRSIETIGKTAFWTEDRAVKMVQLLLLYDLNDSAAAFLDRFTDSGVLSEHRAASLSRVVSGWTDVASEFFWFHRTIIFFLHLSPWKCIAALRGQRA